MRTRGGPDVRGIRLFVANWPAAYARDTAATSRAIGALEASTLRIYRRMARSAFRVEVAVLVRRPLGRARILDQGAAACERKVIAGASPNGGAAAAGDFATSSPRSPSASWPRCCCGAAARRTGDRPRRRQGGGPVRLARAQVSSAGPLGVTRIEIEPGLRALRDPGPRLYCVDRVADSGGFVAICGAE